jgi:hypothetical protein
MVHVFRLGPLDVSGRPAWAFTGVEDDGTIIRPAIEHSETKALAAIAKEYAGTELRCV